MTPPAQTAETAYADPAPPWLDPQTAALLDLMCRGLTVGAAAQHLSMSRRTAVRRIAAAREARGVDSTAALLVRHRTDGVVDRVAAAASTDPADRPELVTAREREVLDLVAAGHSNPEIARLLGVSRPTVRRLLDNARAKLGARDRVEAAALLALHHHRED